MVTSASKHEEKHFGSKFVFFWRANFIETHFQPDELCWRLSTQEKLHLSTLERLLIFECTFPFFQNLKLDTSELIQIIKKNIRKNRAAKCKTGNKTRVSQRHSCRRVASKGAFANDAGLLRETLNATFPWMERIKVTNLGNVNTKFLPDDLKEYL